MKDAIRSRTFSADLGTLGRQLGEYARDVSDGFAGLEAFRQLAFTEVYTEPLYVGFDHEPTMVLAGRVRTDATPEASVNGNARVCFNWNASQGRLEIASIDGCSVGTKYRFNFLAVG